MKLLCITDPHTHPERDTTVALYLRAIAHPAIELFHIHPNNVQISTETEVIRVESLDGYQSFLQLDQRQSEKINVASLDLVFCRTDKPYADDYLDRLQGLEEFVPFVNSPKGIKRHILGEIFYEAAVSYIPEHIFTRDSEAVKDFQKRFPILIAKRSNSYGGKGVFKIWQDGDSFLRDNIVGGEREFNSLDDLLYDLFLSDAGEFQFVKYLKNIEKGDKRVLVVDGEIYGGYLRLSADDHWVHNFSSGGGIHPDTVGEREVEIVESTWRAYRDQGIRTLGYDFLVDDDDSWILSEINAGSIGGYGRLETLYGFPAWEKLLAYLIELSVK